MIHHGDTESTEDISFSMPGGAGIGKTHSLRGQRWEVWFHDGW